MQRCNIFGPDAILQWDAVDCSGRVVRLHRVYDDDMVSPLDLGQGVEEGRPYGQAL